MIEYDVELDGTATVTGEGTLITIHFQGIAPHESSPISFQLDSALWGVGTQIPCTITDGSVTVTEAATDTPQPTPTSASTATRTPTASPRETNTPAPTRTAKPTNTPRPTATPKNTATPKPPQEKPESTKAAVAAAGAQPTPSGGRCRQPVPARCPSKCGAGSSSAAPSSWGWRRGLSPSASTRDRRKTSASGTVSPIPRGIAEKDKPPFRAACTLLDTGHTGTSRQPTRPASFIPFSAIPLERAHLEGRLLGKLLHRRIAQLLTRCLELLHVPDA